jgi:hypothetical protein
LARPRLEKKFSPHKKYSFNYENAEPASSLTKLPAIQPQKALSPQVKNIKQEILQKLRQNCRVKSEAPESYACKSKRAKKDLMVDIQITKKQVVTKGAPKVPLKSREELVDGFMLTFRKTKGKKLSEAYISSSTHSNKAP